jgi:hypothetical protein
MTQSSRARRLTPAPQSSQNLDSGSFSAPHCGHRIAGELPQWAQNFRPVLLSVPHFVQRICFAAKSCLEILSDTLGERVA